MDVEECKEAQLEGVSCIIGDTSFIIIEEEEGEFCIVLFHWKLTGFRDGRI